MNDVTFAQFISHRFWWHDVKLLLAFFLIEKFLQDVFPNFSMEQVGTDEDGIWMLGTCVGIGFEKWSGRNPDGTKSKESIAMTIAREFKLFEKHPEIIALVEDIEDLHQNGPTGALPYAQVVRSFAAFHSREKVIQRAKEDFSARIFMNYKLFHDPAVIAAFETAYRYRGKGGREILVYQVNRMSPTISPYAFFRGAECVVVYHYDTGQVQILGNSDKKVDLSRVFEEIVKIEPEGKRRWYCEKDPHQMILNGSTKYPNVPATEIYIEDLIKIVQQHIK